MRVESNSCTALDTHQAEWLTPTNALGIEPSALAVGVADVASDRGEGLYSRRSTLAYRSETVTPPEKAESCRSISAGMAPSGISKTRVPLTVFPGLISLIHTSLSSR